MGCVGNFNPIVKMKHPVSSQLDVVATFKIKNQFIPSPSRTTTGLILVTSEICRKSQYRAWPHPHQNIFNQSICPSNTTSYCYHNPTLGQFWNKCRDHTNPFILEHLSSTLWGYNPQVALSCILELHATWFSCNLRYVGNLILEFDHNLQSILHSPDCHVGSKLSLVSISLL